MIEGAEGKDGTTLDAFLLDGQQRSTSLYQSLRHEGPVDTHDNRGRRIKRWYYIDMLAAMDPNADREDAIISVPEDKRETTNFGREVVRNLSSREFEYEQHMMPTERLLDNSLSWLFGYVGHWNGRDDEHPDGGGFAFYERFNQSVMSQFSEYNLPVISLDKETPKEAVCTVFEKVNTGGVTLSMFELVTASFAAQDENLSLREDWGAQEPPARRVWRVAGNRWRPISAGCGIANHPETPPGGYRGRASSESRSGHQLQEKRHSGFGSVRLPRMGGPGRERVYRGSKVPP